MTETTGSRPLAGRRVLVVEDEFFIADDLARALSRLGADVAGPVPTLDEAMALVSDGGIELAVLDIDLQGESGLAVADVLMERRLPFVFATGYDEAFLPERFHAVTQWRKPFSASALAAILPVLVPDSPIAGEGRHHRCIR